MSHKSMRYISNRVFLLLVSLGTLILIMLIHSTVRAIIEKRLDIILLIYSLLAMLIGYFGYRWVYKPYKETSKTFRLFAESLVLEGIYQVRCPYSPQIHKATFRFKEMLDTKELIRISKKQAEYLALQNQINPHFLYNTLEGIRSEVLCAGLEDVAKMTENLGTFFRYTISNVDSLVTLEDELMNIENYYSIQQYRFGDRLSVSVEYDEEDEKEVGMYRLPKLTLQPIVENSIYHGIERKVGKGSLRIKVMTTLNRLLITVSDDGLGMDEEKLIQLNKRLRQTSLDGVALDTNQQGGIAVVNVNSRIKLLFGDEYGIHIYSTKNVGTDVVITLPKVKE